MGINKRRLFQPRFFDAVTLEVRLRLWDATFNVHSDTTVPSEQHIVFLIRACCCFGHVPTEDPQAPTSQRCLAHSSESSIVRRVSKQHYVRAISFLWPRRLLARIHSPANVNNRIVRQFPRGRKSRIVSTGLRRISCYDKDNE
jgi:hypothetical protein